MKVIFVRAMATGYSPTSYAEKTHTVYMPILVEDTFDIDNAKLTPVGIEQAPGLEYTRLANRFKTAILNM